MSDNLAAQGYIMPLAT